MTPDQPSVPEEASSASLRRPLIDPIRVAFLLAAIVIVIALIGVRTAYLQSAKLSTLRKYADNQQQTAQELPAVRGDILDRNGQELAVGEDAVTFYATPSAPGLADNPAATAVRVAELLGMTEREERDLVERLSDSSSGFAYVRRQVPRARADRLIKVVQKGVKKDGRTISGIGWYDDERRIYPLERVGGQLLGTVDVDDRGVAGVESLYDRSLGGRAGRQVIVRDAMGNPIDVLSLQREIDGRDVQLTIDATIQMEAERVLERAVERYGAKGATAVVMNPRTGEVLAMASVPTVDANRFGTAPGSAQRQRAITDVYEPGSTFKVVAISAALEEGLVTPSTSFLLPPVIQVADREIEDSHERGTERMTTRDILVESSNVGTVTIARNLLGGERLDSWIRRFGFGRPTGIDFPGEEAGLMLERKDWSGSTIGNLPIGQGISATPMQVVSAYAAIANDGVLVQPHLLERIGDEPPAHHGSRRVLSIRTARIMQRMFGDVVTDERGTGRNAQIPGYAVAGKTGTSEVAGPGGYIKGRYIASFVGFVPARNPQLVTLVVIDEPTSGQYGGDSAAPAFEEITEFALQYLAIPPDGIV